MTKLIGQRLKQLRREKKLTLKELSDKSNLSIGFLSKVERGVSTISVESLAVIARCLGANVNYFFEENTIADRDDIAVKSFERNMLYSESPLRINYLLANNIKDKLFVPKLVELLPGFNTELQASHHEGQEFIYVLEGIVTIFVLDERMELYPGDSACFDSTQFHSWVNYTNMLVKLIVVTAPNVYSD